jgi:acetyltransferase
MLVSDCRQHQGIGTQLMHRLIAIARREQLSHIVAVILPGNRPMQKLCRSFGFVIEHDQLSEMMTATLDLTQVSEK